VFCEPSETLAIERLRTSFYDVRVLPRDEMLEGIRDFGAHLVVHDELDTKPEHLDAERAAGMRVAVFEDTGPGQAHADLVFNALFPGEETDEASNRFFGAKVYCLREEFRHREPAAFNATPQRVLVTFGGTDPSRLTLRVLEALQTECNLDITVIAGRGVSYFEELEERVRELSSSGQSIALHRDVAMMSEHMAQADIAFTSAGRTLYELAHMRVPAIAFAQNETEMKHRFASIENGFIFLGLGQKTSSEDLAAAFHAMTTSWQLRKSLYDRMSEIDLTLGRDFVVRKLLEIRS
jgi:spore coat polysaccharide biosynthesis predicted glycosyltransferase SpsG